MPWGSTGCTCSRLGLGLGLGAMGLHGVHMQPRVGLNQAGFGKQSIGRQRITKQESVGRGR